MAELYSNCGEFICFHFLSEGKVSTSLCIDEWPCGSGGKVGSCKRSHQLKRRGEYQFACSERFRLYQGLSKISAWNTRMTRKGSRHRLTIRCLKKNKLSSERTLSTHSKQEVKRKRKRFTPPLLRTSPSPTRNPCHRYTPRKRSAPGHAQTMFRVFPL